MKARKPFFFSRLVCHVNIFCFTFEQVGIVFLVLHLQLQYEATTYSTVRAGKALEYISISMLPPTYRHLTLSSSPRLSAPKQSKALSPLPSLVSEQRLEIWTSHFLLQTKQMFLEQRHLLPRCIKKSIIVKNKHRNNVIV